MSEERVVVREIAWRDLVPGVRLLQALRLALSPRALVLAAAALVATTAGWKALGLAFPSAPGANEVIWPWEMWGHAPELHWLGPELWRGGQQATPIIPWHYLSSFGVRLFSGDLQLRFSDCAYLLLGLLWTIAVWALFGGILGRHLALALARRERAPLGSLVSFAARRWTSYFGAPMFPLFGALLATLPLAVVGLMLRSSVLTVVAGLLWPLVILAAVFMAILLLGLLFGWPLMWSTISVEGTDAFGALSSSYAYVTQRPVLYVVYAIVASIIGSIGWFFVYLFATTVMSLIMWGVSWGSGAETAMTVFHGDLETMSGAEWLGVALIRFWMGWISTLAIAFLFSYLWSVATTVYFLLRFHVDGTELDEVFLGDDENNYGLPPLAKDAAGVVGVADEAGSPPPPAEG